MKLRRFVSLLSILVVLVLQWRFCRSRPSRRQWGGFHY